uniref:Uncharacterized protein n=1 Tax=Nelumbo nucifera TaxID=4432 RepID=A0A822YUA1_NELNU|nr:TPA_asm: hypothetical protein HUJ06_006730 [Nelumbo nucifera]
MDDDDVYIYICLLVDCFCSLNYPGKSIQLNPLTPSINHL